MYIALQSTRVNYTEQRHTFPRGSRRFLKAFFHPPYSSSSIYFPYFLPPPKRKKAGNSREGTTATASTMSAGDLSTAASTFEDVSMVGSEGDGDLDDVDFPDSDEDEEDEETTLLRQEVRDGSLHSLFHGSQASRFAKRG